MAVDTALSKVPQDVSIYTDETVSALQNAIDNVDTSLSAAEQSKVDDMAKAIENAIAALEYKEADYSKVDEAIAKADALNPDDYTNFSTVEAAVNTVVRGKNITEQDKVDNMALAIENAIANLEKKPATGTTSDNDTSSPQTGDDSNITLWLAVMLASGVALTVTVFYNRRKKYSR